MRANVTLGLLLAVTACSREPGRAPEPAGGSGSSAAPVADVPAQARAEFELVPDAFGGGTSKQYSRSDFLPLDDERAMSEGDFIGRLRALFGAVDGDEYTLRHRKTGFIITAYSAQSGPSYGGAPRYPGALPDKPAPIDTFFRGDDRKARIDADPVLAAGRPVDWSTIDLDALSRDELRALRVKERAWMKRLADATAPPGFADVAHRLDELVSAVPPVNWETIRYWGEDPSVYRVGARNGEGFDEMLSVPDGLAVLIAQAEGLGQDIIDTSGHPTDADEQVVSFWIHHRTGPSEDSDEPAAARAEAVRALEATLPQVQAAWFRMVTASQTESADLRASVHEYLREQIEPLRIDPAKADAALRAAAAAPSTTP